MRQFSSNVPQKAEKMGKSEKHLGQNRLRYHAIMLSVGSRLDFISNYILQCADNKNMGNQKVKFYQQGDLYWPDLYKIKFHQQGDLLWHDLNKDGRVQKREQLNVEKGKELEAANQFMAKNPHYFPVCNKKWKNFSITNVKQFREIFDHPVKKKFAKQLDNDIKTLKGMKNRPREYSLLLADLIIVRNELPYIQFAFHVEDESFRQKYLKPPSPRWVAMHDPELNKIYMNYAQEPLRSTRSDVLIHEMIHVVLRKRKTAEWSVPYKFSCKSDNKVINIPHDTETPLPHLVKTKFTFSLDSDPNVVLTYDDVDMKMYEIVERGLSHGSFPCKNDKYRKAFFANEAYAWQVSARYVLFRGGYIPESDNGKAKSTTSVETAIKRYFVQEVGPNIGIPVPKELSMDQLNKFMDSRIMYTSTFSGKQYTPKLHNELLKMPDRYRKKFLNYYLGKGGPTGNENLLGFLQKVYGPIFTRDSGIKLIESDSVPRSTKKCIEW